MSGAFFRNLPPQTCVKAINMRSRTYLSLLILLMPISVLAYTSSRVCCLSNLRQLDGAKATLALEHKLRPGDPVDPEMLGPYFGGGVIPQFPTGGHYTIGPIEEYPVCSLLGHSETEFKREMDRQARHEHIVFWLRIAGGSVVAVWWRFGQC